MSRIESIATQFVGVRAWLAVSCAVLLNACALTPFESEPPPSAPAPAAQQTSEPASESSSSLVTTPLESSTPTAKPTVIDDASIPPEARQQFDNAVSMMTSGNSAGAESAFTSLATAYPSYSGALLNLGILQARAGKLDDAQRSLQGALERNTNNAAALNQLGIVYRRLGKFGDARSAYERAVQADPNYANAWLNQGVLLDLYLQQPERALESYERYLTLAGTPDARVANWVSELKSRVKSPAAAPEATP